MNTAQDVHAIELPSSLSNPAALARKLWTVILRSAHSPMELELIASHRPHAQYERIQKLVAANKPLHFVLPAFPAKSSNPQKTLGALPDMGEFIALSRMQVLMNKLSSLYAPGARITICSDGRVFSDLVGVQDSDVNAYGDRLRQIIQEESFDRIDTFHLEDLFGSLSYDEMRAKLVNEYAQSVKAIREGILSDENEQRLFNGIHRFVFEDRMSQNEGLSRNKVRNLTKDMAYQVVQRSHAWSQVVEKQFPEAIRLSIHPQLASSSKLAFQLVSSGDRWRTPWHSVVLKQNGQFGLVTRREAEAQGAVLKSHKGQYAYFEGASRVGLL